MDFSNGLQFRISKCLLNIAILILVLVTSNSMCAKLKLPPPFSGLPSSLLCIHHWQSRAGAGSYQLMGPYCVPLFPTPVWPWCEHLLHR